MTLDYYYGDQAEQFSFYRIPKVLFTDSRFKDISAEAKILYGLLLDRMSLSAKNGWLDQEGRVYIVYTVEDIMDALSCASQKAMKLLNELDEKCGLIERKRQGLGKPNLIYVKNFVSAPESKFKNGENQNSGLLKIETQEFPKSKGSNTEKNNTDFNDTESFPFPSFRDGQKRESKGNDAERRAQYRELIMENISYDVLLVDLPYDKEIVEEILELIVDTVCTTKQTVRISGDDKPAEVVRSRFLKLDSEHIRFVVSCMKENTTKIKNIRQYLLATLYNASLTMTSYYAALWFSTIWRKDVFRRRWLYGLRRFACYGGERYAKEDRTKGHTEHPAGAGAAGTHFGYPPLQESSVQGGGRCAHAGDGRQHHAVRRAQSHHHPARSRRRL